MMDTPRSRRPRTRSRSSALSASDRAAVGSSRIRTLVSRKDSARAISTIWALLTVRSRRGVRGSTPIS